MPIDNMKQFLSRMSRQKDSKTFSPANIRKEGVKELSNDVVVVFNAQSLDQVTAAGIVKDYAERHKKNTVTFISIHGEDNTTLKREMFENRRVLYLDGGPQGDPDWFQDSIVVKFKKGKSVSTMAEPGQTIIYGEDKTISNLVLDFIAPDKTKNPTPLWFDEMNKFLAGVGDSNSLERFTYENTLDTLGLINDELLREPLEQTVASNITGAVEKEITAEDRAARLVDFIRGRRQAFVVSGALADKVPSKLDSGPDKKAFLEFIGKTEQEELAATDEQITNWIYEAHMKAIYQNKIPKNVTVATHKQMLSHAAEFRKSLVEKLAKEVDEYVDIVTPEGLVEKVPVFRAGSLESRKVADLVAENLAKTSDSKLALYLEQVSRTKYRVSAKTVTPRDSATVAQMVNEGAVYGFDDLRKILRPHATYWWEDVARSQSWFNPKIQAEWATTLLEMPARPIMAKIVESVPGFEDLTKREYRIAAQDIVTKASRATIKFAEKHPFQWYGYAGIAVAGALGILRGADFALESWTMDRHRNRYENPNDEEYKGNPALANWRKAISHQQW